METPPKIQSHNIKNLNTNLKGALRFTDANGMSRTSSVVAVTILRYRYKPETR